MHKLELYTINKSPGENPAFQKNSLVRHQRVIPSCLQAELGSVCFHRLHLPKCNSVIAFGRKQIARKVASPQTSNNERSSAGGGASPLHPEGISHISWLCPLFKCNHTHTPALVLLLCRWFSVILSVTGRDCQALSGPNDSRTQVG